jgi:hypothetical protein
MHAVFVLNEIMEDVKVNKSNAYAVFLDFSKAFDKVNRTKLLYKLMFTLNPEIWLLLKNYYENLIIYVLDSKGQISEPFKSTVGVKQGGPASPDLFNDYIDELISNLESGGHTYDINGLQKGVMVYADDTTLVCSDLKKVNKCVHIIETYCKLYDISINAKKTKFMVFGTLRSVVEPEIKVNGQIIEMVDIFKFLGVQIDREGTFKKHLSIRRSAFFTGLTEVEKLGFHKKDVPPKMKSLLYTSLVRSKLVYGLEGIRMTKSSTKKDLTFLESYALKRSCGLNKYSKSTALLYALNITPISLYIYKRKLYFILQLLANTSTRELLSKRVHKTLNDIITSVGIKREHLILGEDRYRGLMRSLAIKKLEEIELKEKLIKNSKIVISVEYLLEHRSSENNDTLQYLLDPRRCGKG